MHLAISHACCLVPLKPHHSLFPPATAVVSVTIGPMIAIQLWNERIKVYKHRPPPEGSFMQRICAKHGVATG
jgi:hypothetical protein